jgi:hypothetical protein
LFSYYDYTLDNLSNKQYLQYARHTLFKDHFVILFILYVDQSEFDSFLPVPYDVSTLALCRYYHENLGRVVISPCFFEMFFHFLVL